MIRQNFFFFFFLLFLLFNISAKKDVHGVWLSGLKTKPGYAVYLSQEMQPQKISEHMCSTNSLYRRNYKKIKIKQSFIQLQHRCLQKWLYVFVFFHDGSFALNTPQPHPYPKFFYSIAFQVDYWYFFPQQNSFWFPVFFFIYFYYYFFLSF